MKNKDIISEQIDSTDDAINGKKSKQLLSQFKSLLNTLPDPVFMKDENLRWIYGNPVILNLYNIPKDDYVGKTEDQLLPPEFAPDCMASDARAKETKTIGVSEERARDPEGNIHYYEVFKVPSYDCDTGKFQGLIGIGRDVTIRKNAESNLKESLEKQRRLIEYDTLTDLFTRSHAKQLIHALIDPLFLKDGYLIVIDIDKFHYFNDIFGHEKGDQFLQTFAGALQDAFGLEAIIARFGGNTFAVFIHSILKAEKSIEMIYDAIHTINATFGKTYLFRFSVSIGIAKVEKGANIDDLFNRADIALHLSKQKWGNSHHFYDTKHAEHIKEKIYFHNQLATLLEEPERITLFYQPIIDLANPSLKKCEALLRIRNEEGVYFLDPKLISSAEKFGLIGEITRIIIRKAFIQLRQWNRANIAVDLSINLSGDDLADEILAHEIISMAHEYEIDPKNVIFEVTENQSLAIVEQASEWTNFLKTNGFRFALDDFGVGYASLEYLKKLPFDYVKIDGSFVKDICTNKDDYAVVEAIGKITQAFGLQSIAEYVEDSAILTKIQALGITHAQGWHFSQAVDAESIEKYWKTLGY